jgi:hypothetical protein
MMWRLLYLSLVFAPASAAEFTKDQLLGSWQLQGIASEHPGSIEAASPETYTFHHDWRLHSKARDSMGRWSISDNSIVVYSDQSEVRFSIISISKQQMVWSMAVGDKTSYHHLKRVR